MEIPCAAPQHHQNTNPDALARAGVAENLHLHRRSRRADPYGWDDGLVHDRCSRHADPYGWDDGLVLDSSLGLISPAVGTDEQTLIDGLAAMRIGDGTQSTVSAAARQPLASLGHGGFSISSHEYAQRFASFGRGGCLMSPYEYAAAQDSVLGRPAVLDSHRPYFDQANLLEFQRPDPPTPYSSTYYEDSYRYGGGIRGSFGYGGGIHGVDKARLQSLPLTQPSGLLNSSSSPQPVFPSSLYFSLAVDGRAATVPQVWLPRSAPSLRPIEAFNCNADRFKGGLSLQREPKYCEQSISSPFCSSQTMEMKFDNLMEIGERIHYAAKDQNGCRFLQKKLEDGTVQDVEVIFNSVVDHVAELMLNPFGNYLMQKLLDRCTEEQKMRILIVITRHPMELIKISLNTHGTRAVQKLIDTLRTRQQAVLVVSALQPGILNLIKDPNGNHVVQRCLQSFAPEDNRFIFDVALKHCVSIATHQHGCCVLQRCISYATREYQLRLIAEISANGLLLAEDPFGNYAVQYILGLEEQSAISSLASQFHGKYVHLSVQKFSSNVVEKCLKVFDENKKAQIVVELLSVSYFEQLLHDPFANYVIQSALENIEGPLHTTLLKAIRPHAERLRTSPYCKRIFSKFLLTK